VERVSEEIQHIAEKIIKASKHSAEVLISDVSKFNIVYDRFIIPSYSNHQTLSIRSTYGKKSGFSSCTDPSKWRNCLKNAEKLMRVSKELDLEPVLPSKQRYPRISYSKKLAQKTFESLYNSFKTSLELKTKVTHASLSKASAESLFMNSNDILASNRDAAMSFSIETKFRNTTSFNAKVSRELFNPLPVAKEAEHYCLLSQKPKPVKPMTVDAVFDYFALSALVNALLVPAFYANRVQKNESFLSGKLGEQLFSEKLKIHDNATKGLIASPFDAEGVRSQDKTIVEKGVVSSFLYDSYSSQKDKTKSTGNCNSLSKRPSIGPSNFTIKQGATKIDTRKYLHIRSITGVHTANPVSGDFSVNLDNAFYKGKPVKHAMVAGNILELFNNIAAIGNKSRQEDSVSTPPILFRDVKVIS
jgi:PmbA protein